MRFTFRGIVRLSAILCVPVLLALAVSPARAQSGTGEFQGTITDASGAAMPGVTVTATSPALQVQSVTAVSGADGSYRLQNLPVGFYELKYELTGFQTIVRQEQRITGDFVATINIEMKIGALEEALTVVGQNPVVDIKTTSSQTTFTQELLEAAPVTRTMHQVLGMTPGVRLNSLDISGNVTGNQTSWTTYGVGGQGAVLVDGFDISHDQAGSIMFYVDQNSFEEVNVRALGSGADLPGAGTNFLGIVKSGGNQFHGRYLFNGQSEGMSGSNLDAALRAQGIRNGDKLQHSYDVSGDIGGRILKDKLWFYGDYARQAISKVLLGYAAAPGPDGKYGTADDVQGYPPVSIQTETVKVSYQPSSVTKINFLYVPEQKIDAQETATTLRPFESTHYYDFEPRLYKGEWQRTMSSRVMLDVFAGWVPYWSNRDAQPGIDKPGNPSRFDQTTLRYTGPAPDPNHYYKDRAELQGSMSFFSTRGHDLKLGYMEDWSHYGANFPTMPHGNYLLTYNNGAPFQFTTYNYPIFTKTDARMHNFAFFANDRWTDVGTKRLTVTMGIRYEQFHNYVMPLTKAVGQFGSSGTYPGLDVVTWRGVAPRVGAAFDLTGDAKTVLKATYGRFNKNPTVQRSNNFNKNSVQTTVYRWRDLNGNNDYDPGEVNLDLNGADFVSTAGASSLLVNTDLKQPYSHEISLAVEREMAENFSLRGAYIYKANLNTDITVNAQRPRGAWNVPVVRQDPGPDGVAGTADDGAFLTIYDYDPAYRGAAFGATTNANRTGDRAKDSWHSIEVTANKRQTRNLPVNLVASFVATKNHRWLVSNGGSPQASVALINTPNDAFFPLDTTWVWTGKVTANYLAPYGIRLSLVTEGQNGAKAQRTYVFRNMPQSSTITLPLEPYGERRLPDYYVTYLKVGKQLSLGAQRRLDLSATVHNLFNANTATSISYVSGPTFGQLDASSQNGGSSAILLPRSVQLGATFTF